MLFRQQFDHINIVSALSSCPWEATNAPSLTGTLMKWVNPKADSLRQPLVSEPIFTRRQTEVRRLLSVYTLCGGRRRGGGSRRRMKCQFVASVFTDIWPVLRRSMYPTTTTPTKESHYWTSSYGL